MTQNLVSVWARPPHAGLEGERSGGRMRWARQRRRSSLVAGLSLPRRVTPDVLCDVISERVGKPIHRLYVAMPPELPSGWVAVRATSLSIIIDSAASRWLRDMVLCHELAHLAHGHHLLELDDPEAIRRLLPNLDPAAVRATLGEPGEGTVEGTLARTCFEGAAEREAEELGTELFELLNPWRGEQRWDVPERAAGVITRIERALGDQE
ncbi:hypothetical protein OHA72_48010 [Dactylosporangium sp. NBC_01737]|uniref:hypothetical protein n=1 Tax=Dactylosporangium sp. NBC_01737 TaxID=2975959 RepID=UPI002E0E4A2D|nr:hypothetical protein OHA72_48010 [Dactylosporangium sp. NBC_01737]